MIEHGVFFIVYFNFIQRRTTNNGVPHQDHFTDMVNGDMNGTNNIAKTINRGLKILSNLGKKTLITAYRIIYSFKADCNKNTA